MDLRIQKTYRSLITSFTQLLETHKLEDVSVAMLCDAAMIRRTTFYKHFADKSAFFAFFVDSLREELLQNAVKTVECDEPHGVQGGQHALDTDEFGRAIWRGLVEFALEHEQMVHNIYESSSAGLMEHMMVDKVAETIRLHHKKAVKQGANGLFTLKAASEFAAGGVVRLLETWWEAGHSKKDEEQLIILASSMVSAVVGLECDCEVATKS